LVHSLDEQTLLTKICTAIAKYEDYDFVWVASKNEEKIFSFDSTTKSGNWKKFIVNKKLKWQSHKIPFNC